MPDTQQHCDVMTAVLNDSSLSATAELDELNCLIYRTTEDLKEEVERVSALENVWSAANGQVTVHVWESRAKIRIKVSRMAKTKLSMDRIAQIAVEAITDELNQEIL